MKISKNFDGVSLGASANFCCSRILSRMIRSLTLKGSPGGLLLLYVRLRLTSEVRVGSATDKNNSFRRAEIVSRAACRLNDLCGVHGQGICRTLVCPDCGHVRLVPGKN